MHKYSNIHFHIKSTDTPTCFYPLGSSSLLRQFLVPILAVVCLTVV